MLFILGVTLAAIMVIGLGALGALALLLRSKLQAAQEQIETLQARLAAPTVWEGLGTEWSQRQALTAALVARPLATAVLPSPDFAGPRAWLLDPPEPGAPSEARAEPARQPERQRRGRSVMRALTGDGVQSHLFPAWTADAGLARAEPAPPPVAAPAAAIGAALFGVYALAVAAGALFSWPWLATVVVLAVFGVLMIAGFWRAERSIGVCCGVAMMGMAPWAGALAGAQASLILPAAGGGVAAAALWGLGRREPALTWTATVLLALGALASALLVATGVWIAAPAMSASLVLVTLGALGLIKANADGEPAARRPASALHAAALAALACGGLVYGVAGPFGVGLGALVAASAGLAVGRGRDAALVSAWFAGSVGLYGLSGDPAAAWMMTPAATAMGAAFFGAGAARAPAPEAHGVVPFALAAAGALTAALVTDTGAAGFAAAAVLLGALLFGTTHARGGAQFADWRFWPLSLASAGALGQALTLAAPPVTASALAGLCALCLIVLAARTGAGALGAGAAVMAVFTALSALEASQLTPLRLTTAAGAALSALTLLGGAWIAGPRGLGAFRQTGAIGAPVAGLALGAAGLVIVIAAALLAAVAAPSRFAVIGSCGAVWLATALALRTGGAQGGVAYALSGPFMLLGLGAAAWAWLGHPNPWWGAQAAPLPAGAAQLSLFAGGALPALAAAAAAWRLGAEGKARMGIALSAAAGIGALIWVALSLRVLGQGPAALRGEAFAPLEMLGFSAALAAAGALLALLGRDRRAIAARRAGLVLMGVAAAKIVTLDLHAAGLAPALAATALALAALAGVIAQRDRLAAAWRGL